MTDSSIRTLIDISTKIPLKTSVALTTIVSCTVLANGVVWADSPSSTLVNIETAWNVFHQLEVRSNNSFMPLPTPADIATNRVRTV